MADRPIPDIARLLVAHLNTAFPEAGVSTRLPTSPAYPHVTLRWITGATVHPRHQYTAVVQFDVWAATETSASSTIRLLIDRLLQARNTVHDAGTLTNVELLSGPTSGLDPENTNIHVWRADLQFAVHP